FQSRLRNEDTDRSGVAASLVLLHAYVGALSQLLDPPGDEGVPGGNFHELVGDVHEAANRPQTSSTFAPNFNCGSQPKDLASPGTNLKSLRLTQPLYSVLPLTTEPEYTLFHK